MDGWQPLSTVQGSITPSPLQAAVVQSPNLPPTGPGVENLGAQGPPPQVKPSNYMVNSILVTSSVVGLLGLSLLLSQARSTDFGLPVIIRALKKLPVELKNGVISQWSVPFYSR